MFLTFPSIQPAYLDSAKLQQVKISNKHFCGKTFKRLKFLFEMYLLSVAITHSKV